MSSPAQFRNHESVLGSSRTASLHLRGDREGFAEARDFTHRTLDGWSLDHCTDDALTVVTELASNAVLHGLPHLSTDHFDVRLRLTLRRAHLLCAVTDPSDSPPLYPHPGDDLLEHGRGLHIVEALSEHWGWTRRSPVGKTVWAMLPTRTSTT
ncbi:ATP-binding protein [Streptomyces sp. NBC_00582]|uniref:ATP-binding protein n=1 Tax=Streptomyces sp. NBC_00582 TaxID=2975783 RepID=UPI0010DE63D9|nr:ATP-binding protein [Streptomyces sp. NBC_00582]WUB60111.1 ATP-binding protein [Streptomyces sp. NBC_00582]